MITKKFNISIDVFTKVLTFSIFILCFFVVVNFLIDYNFIPAILVSLLIGVALYFFPIYYSITDKNIVIKRLFSKRKIPLKEIYHINSVKNTVPFSYSTKGVFGYLGKTMDGTISYSTNLKKNVLIKTNNDEKFIISPKNIEKFINEINKRKNYDEKSY